MASTVHALDPNKRVTQYIHMSWRMQDGSAPSGMSAISQTSDGFLWLVSGSGDLYRFDGVRFLPKPVTAKGLVHAVQNVFSDHAGALWLLGNRGVVRLERGIATSHFDLDGLVFLQNVSEDPDGSLWVARGANRISDQPLCHITGQAVKCFGVADGIPFSPIDSLLADGQGGFWLGGHRTLVHWHGGVSDTYPIKALKSNAGADGIISLVRGADGVLWVGIASEGRGLGLGRLIGGVFRPFVTPAFDGSKVAVSGMVFDRDGNLWVATYSKGVFRIRDNVVDHYDHTDGLSGDSVDSVFEDREGIVWAATVSGIDSFRDPRVTTFSSLQGLRQDEAMGVLATKDGRIWVANGEWLDYIVNGVVSSNRAKGGPLGAQVGAMLEDRAGNVWVGVDDGLYLFKNGRFRRLLELNHQPLGLIVALTEDTDGNIWAECVGNPTRLVRIHDFQVREQFSASQVPPGHALASDPKGGIWVGTLKGDILLFRNGVIEAQFPLNPGGDPATQQITAERDGSVLAASDYGLVGWRQGKVQRMTTKNGLPCDRVISFLEDKTKLWWLYTSCGVVELPDSELQKWWANPEAVVQTRLSDVLDGAKPPASGPAFNPATQSPDGRLWFTNGHFVQMIDPSKTSKEAAAAMTYIESATVDRKELSATNDLKLPPRPRELQIDYTSPTFLIPQKVKFRYRLDGYDHEWNDAGTRRQAFYTDLPPADYSFRVIASNSDGVWNEHAAKLDFSVVPAYYQTNWFRAVIGGLFLASLWAAYQLRVRQLQSQFALALEARVDERTRIARELHDTLLQSAHGLLLRFEIVSQLFDQRPVEAKQQLDSAIKQTADFVTQARDEVQGLRDSTEVGSDLGAEISSLGDALASESANRQPIAFHVAVEGAAKNLHPILRDEIYKICAEALRNSFRHSQARRVEVEIRYDHDQFRLRVRDDGKGIDPAILSSQSAEGHYGLQGMRERAALIGGNLAVWSRADAGTEVELRVSAAYAKKRRRWWFPHKDNL